MDKYFHPTIYNECNNLSMLWLESIHNKIASFQKEAMRTQVALWFFYEVKLYEGKCLCVW